MSTFMSSPARSLLTHKANTAIAIPSYSMHPPTPPHQ